METRIKIILVETTHPGNIGSVARAMKTMGETQLCLVRPERYPSAEASALASGADDVLTQAQVFDSLEEAIADCTLCLGVSARQRNLVLPVLTPKTCAEKVITSPRRVVSTAEEPESIAILFGRESRGLTNEELDCCHYLVSIAANPAYPSLNIAMAVQIITYELYQARLRVEGDPVSHDPSVSREPERFSRDTPKYALGETPATAKDMQLFYQHLESMLVKTGFLDPQNPKFLMRRLKRLFNRAQPDKNEINILRGFLTAIRQSIQ